MKNQNWTELLKACSLNPLDEFTLTGEQVITLSEMIVGVTTRPAMAGRRSGMIHDADVASIQLCLDEESPLSPEKQIVAVLESRGFVGGKQLPQDSIVVVHRDSVVDILYYEDREITLDGIPKTDYLVHYRLSSLNALWGRNVRQQYNHRLAVSGYKGVGDIED